MPLSNADKQNIQALKEACQALNFEEVRTRFQEVAKTYDGRIELSFVVIPDLLCDLRAQAEVGPAEDIARWLVADPRFPTREHFHLGYNIPNALAFKESVQELLSWEVTKPLFSSSNKGIMKRFVQAILNSESEIVNTFLDQMPALSNLRINKAYVSPLTLALSLPNVNQTIVDSLLAHNADPNGDISENNTLLIQYDGISLPEHRPLHQAIISKNLPAFRALTQAEGIDLERKDGFELPDLTPHLAPNMPFYKAELTSTTPPHTPLDLALNAHLRATPTDQTIATMLRELHEKGAKRVTPTHVPANLSVFSVLNAPDENAPSIVTREEPPRQRRRLNPPGEETAGVIHTTLPR